MKSSRRFWLLWGLSLLLGSLALALAAPHDLEVSRAVARPGSTFGWIVTWFGELPGIGLAVLALVFSLGAWRRPEWRPEAPASVALCALTIAHPLGLTQLLKALWGRRRFADLGPAQAGYTPLYRPVGPGGGTSFPSGHVAIASVSLLIPFYLHARGRHRAALAAWMPCAAYPLAVAAGRIYEGRHYLTDTLFSLLVALWLSPLLVRWALRWRPLQPTGTAAGEAAKLASRA